jgi:hypothetical protein
VGDKLEVNVLGSDQEYTVQDDGTIKILIVGDVPAAGYTVQQVQANIEEKLKAGRDLTQPHATVTVLTHERIPCIEGAELGGDLKLKETLATPLIAYAMSDISALLPLEGASPGTLPGGITLGPIPVPSSYSFGVISTQIDFTVIEGISGGPNWTLVYFRGPGTGYSIFRGK